MIYFKSIRWKNLLSTGNVFTEIDLCGKDTTLIVGINGAGKSTLLDALSFGLFGKPFRKINKPQLVNSITQKNCVVEIEFNIGTNEYKIVRGIKPNIFEVYQNGNLLNQSAEMKDYQELLEKQIIKVNHKSFCQVVILGSATFQPFMQLSTSQRREIIEDLLDLQIFTTMNSLLKDKVLVNSESIYSINTNKQLIESKIEITKQHMIEMQSNNDKLIAEKESLIAETAGHVKELQEKYNFTADQIEILKLQKEDEENISKKINKLSKLRHQIEAKVAMFNEDVQFFKDHDNCPTCKQEIAEDFRNKTISEKNQQISEIEDGLKKLSEEYDAANNRLNEIMSVINDINRFEMKNVEYSTSIRSLQKYLNQLQVEIEGINNTQVQQSDYKLLDFEQELKDIEKKYNELIEEKNVLAAASVLLKDGGIKAKIVKQYIPVINKLINKYLSSMDFFVSFELDENFSETIKSRYRDDFTYASFSEGEKQKIDLSLLFTWRAVAKLRNSINTNLLIMDEVFDSSLDQNATDYLMNIIRDVAKDNNIIIISHKEHMNEKFNNVVKFIKNKNFSQIQES
jgi:DNA repair exonuclease SbcCD ATPase subunit